ncbi:helix-turn-helix domain-containing protein [Vagococcus fluvialis]|uniref:helix-turn-helix domain-containing protein n=1 Tax=Vagococcus TaxID=2737 RepID=UPI0028908EFC|nr:helix-turn-helix domain-containing protein [Vagococcus carniphilus]MDT2831875.1 transcriptional regulator [Vagococcus carniphilus]MDT2855385.1 transcriptional regulator [Vagococcus carniphilus]
MFQLENDFSWKLRRKRAKLMLTKSSTSEIIGISRKTYTQVETGQLKKVTRTVYEKLVNWLLEDEGK